MLRITLVETATLALAACATQSRMYDQSALPAAVQAPAGHRVAMETVGVGDITYECRAKAGMAGQFEWVFVGPDARLMDRTGR
ncbi:MAG TPA: DUF3455 domain-containing protein, partial [Ramlibacter sp.]|nr:DUF3455 domain-containing protein [Ramlibacter sp.]